VIDPAKVLRASCLGAGLLVTTEAKIAEKPKPKTSPAIPPGGGMESRQQAWSAAAAAHDRFIA
jgi:chaperonin GroEL